MCTLTDSNFSLELNIHQRILADIASNVEDAKDDITYATDLITSKVKTRVELGHGDEMDEQLRLNREQVEEDSGVDFPEQHVYMVCGFNAF